MHRSSARCVGHPLLDTPAHPTRRHRCLASTMAQAEGRGSSAPAHRLIHTRVNACVCARAYALALTSSSSFAPALFEGRTLISLVMLIGCWASCVCAAPLNTWLLEGYAVHGMGVLCLHRLETCPVSKVSKASGLTGRVEHPTLSRLMLASPYQVEHAVSVAQKAHALTGGPQQRPHVGKHGLNISGQIHMTKRTTPRWISETRR